MLVVAMMCSRKVSTSVSAVLIATLFSHSNSAHMLRNYKRKIICMTCEPRKSIHIT